MNLKLYTQLAEMCDRCIGDQLMLDPRYVLHNFPTLKGGWDMILIVYRQQYQRHIRRTSHVHRRVRIFQYLFNKIDIHTTYIHKYSSPLYLIIHTLT